MENFALRKFQKLNAVACLGNRCENLVANSLKKNKVKFIRQQICGRRIFDFWIPSKGIALEVDGSSHVEHIDQRNDLEMVRKFSIVVVRVRNMNYDDLRNAIQTISNATTWNSRIKRLNLEKPPEWAMPTIKAEKPHKLRNEASRLGSLRYELRKLLDREADQNEFDKCKDIGLKKFKKWYKQENKIQRQYQLEPLAQRNNPLIIK